MTNARNKRSKRRSILWGGLVGAALVSALGSYAIASKLIEPQQRTIGEPPASLGGDTITIEREGLAPLAGWYRPLEDAQGAVLLLHGVRSDRRQMIGRAEFLLAAGYSVLLIDMQAHGESPGDYIGFGYLEARDVVDAVAFLKATHNRVGIIGASLGGAAAVMAAEELVADAIVVEAVYSDISKATVNRLRIRLGSLGDYLAPLLLWQIEPRLGISPDEVSPVNAIGSVQVPVFVISGEADQRTTLSDTQQLFESANDPKALWIVPGAKHQDLHRYSGAEYEQRVLQFLARYLGVDAA